PAVLGQSRHRLRHPGEQFFAWQLRPDHAGGTHQDILDGRVEFPGNTLRCRSSVLVAVRPRVTVRTTTGVENHRTCTTGIHHTLTPNHWIRSATVGGEHSCGDIVGAVIDHERDVGLTARFEARRDSTRTETCRIGNCHGATPVTANPVVSAKSRAIFMDCTAAPAVPLVRLSIAATAVNRPAAASTAT